MAVPEMIDPTTLADAVLDAMASDGRLAVPLNALSAAVGAEAGALDAAIGELLDGDAIEAWDRPGRGLYLVFKALTAEARGLVIDPTGARWISKGDRRKGLPDRLKQRRGEVLECDWYGEDSARGLANEANRRSVDPLEALAIGEAEEASAAKKRGDIKPRFLLGLAVPWPVDPERGEACPGCHGRKLPPTHYCLACDMPRGSMVPKARAHVRKLAKGRADRETAKLKGGMETGRVIGGFLRLLHYVAHRLEGWPMTTPSPTPFRWLQDARCRRSDLKLVRKAIRERWPMPPESRRALIAELLAVLDDERTHREVAMTARTLLSMARADAQDEAKAHRGAKGADGGDGPAVLPFRRL